MSIPASVLVSILPSVVGTGGDQLSMNTALIVEKGMRVVGVERFTNSDAMADYFGPTSDVFKFGERYFRGYDGATAIPQALNVATFLPAASSAIVRGASVASMTLDDLKAIAGDLVVTVNGEVKTNSIDLSLVTSFTEASAMIDLLGFYSCEFNERLQCFELVSDATGETATLTSVSGAAAEALKLTASAGAKSQQGMAAMDGASCAKMVTRYTQNFANFATFDVPADAVKSISEWVTGSNGRFAYTPLDLSSIETIKNSPDALGKWLKTTNQSGTAPYFGTIEQLGALCGGIAAIDYKRTNGRRNIMFMKQAGLAATVTDRDDYDVLVENGYTFYASFATANDSFTFNTNGAVSGPFVWLDNYINQIYFSSQAQLANMTMLENYDSIPYNAEGKAIQLAAIQDPIDEMINFGGIRPLLDPKALSEQQKSIIRQQAGGLDIIPDLLNKGWAAVIQTADAQTRGQRKSMPFSIWYTDGGSVQQVVLSSINVQ